jgi:hypothetical protein
VSDEPLPVPRVEVWQEREGAWQWRYVSVAAGEQLELPGNEPEASEDAAVSATQVAYPQVPVLVARPADADAALDHRRAGHRWRWRLLTAVTALCLAALAVRYRRWGTNLLSPVLASGLSPGLVSGLLSGVRRRLP